MQFLAEVCKMLKLSVKHFVKVVWGHIGVFGYERTA
jgi:hypothetical protein